MIKFLVTAVIVLICVFLMALMVCLMVWIITRLLRFLFPQRFRPAAPTGKKKPKAKAAVSKSKKSRSVVGYVDEEADDEDDT